MDEQLKSNLTSSKHWFRLVYMILFAVLLQVALAVMWVLVVIQFLFALITGNDNRNLRSFGASLSQYIYQAIQFLTYNSEDKPFPFMDWPEAPVVEAPPVAEPAAEPVAAQPASEAVDTAPATDDSHTGDEPQKA